MPVTILVADDSATMRRILEMTFAGEDARVVAVESGAAAIDRATDLRPDIVFADVSMDGTDAYEVSRAIKSNPATSSTCVIALASQLHPYDDAKGRAAGVDDHVLKPFDTQVVISRVAQVLSRPRNVPLGGAPAAAAPAHPYRDGQPLGSGGPPAPAPVTAAASKTAPRTATVAFGSAPVAAKPPAPPAAPPAPPAARPPVAAKPAAPPAAKPSLEIVDDLLAATASAVPAHAHAHAHAPSPVAAPARAAAAATSDGGELAQRLAGLGLTSEQVEGVLKISREVIERVAWEVVPDLAEAIIKEEIRRLTSG